MPRFVPLALLLLLSTALLGSDCGEPGAVPLEELRADVAPPFDYSLYCDTAGRLEGERSAVLLVHRSEHLERVYADSLAGDARARALFGQLESAIQQSGSVLAQEALGFKCATAPACTVQWSFLDEFIPSRGAGGLRLRGLLAGSFSRQAKLQGVRNAVLDAALNVLVAGTALKTGPAGLAESEAGAAEAKVLAEEAERLAREATLEQRVALPSAEGALAAEEAAAEAARLAEAEALEPGPRQPARVEELARYRPQRGRPPQGVATDHPRWGQYVAYWERRYEELTGKRPLPPGETETQPPLTWKSYDALLSRFQRSLEFQRGVTREMQQEARAAGGERLLPQGMKRPLVADNLGLAHEDSASITYSDQFVVDETTVGKGRTLTAHSYSDKQHDFSRKSPDDAVKQFKVDAEEAKTKYGGTVEVRRRGHPLFGQKVVVSRVHIVYDGTNLSNEIREALFEEAKDRGVDLHFHVNVP
ncbi:MAG: hypothetical protein ACJ8AT_02495 [Hyalangium sp.]|uniref:hypothetical protein n=1 Tax=Hyalangium sp. TaxID=2028555 RepID=UPI00389998A7